MNSTIRSPNRKRNFWRDFFYAQVKGCLLLIAVILGLTFLGIVFYQLGWIGR